MNDREYKYIDEDGMPRECDSCGCIVPLQRHAGETKLICEVCSNTEIGSVIDYGTTALSTQDLYLTLAQVANLLLDKLGRGDLARDAARYRWVRSHDVIDWDKMPKVAHDGLSLPALTDAVVDVGVESDD